jgi:hypothetical protein
VKRYFNNLEHLLTKFKFHPHRIFNMDETGVSMVLTKTEKGKDQLTKSWLENVDKPQQLSAV